MFATLAGLRAYLPQVPAYGVQRVTATGGSVVLTYEGASTGSLSSSATATAVEAALKALTPIGSAGVKVSGAPGNWLVAFQGRLATDAGPLTATGATVENETDALLEDCLTRASDTVRQALRRLLADPTFDYAAWGAASTQVVRSYGGWYLSLPAHQAGSVTAIAYDGGDAVSDWLVEDAVLYLAAGWGAQRYRVMAVWGYGPTVPAAVEQVTLELAVNIWRSKDKGGFSEMVGADGGGAIRVVAGLTKQQEATLRNVAEQLMELAV